MLEERMLLQQTNRGRVSQRLVINPHTLWSTGVTKGTCATFRVKHDKHAAAWTATLRDEDTWMSAQSALLEPSLWDGFFFNNYSAGTQESDTNSPRRCTYTGFHATFLMRSRASTVKYGGKLSLHFKILSMVFFLFSAVNGGW